MHNTEKGPGRETRAFLLALLMRPDPCIVLPSTRFAETRTIRPGQPERIVAESL